MLLVCICLIIFTGCYWNWTPVPPMYRCFFHWFLAVWKHAMDVSQVDDWQLGFNSWKMQLLVVCKHPMSSNLMVSPGSWRTDRIFLQLHGIWTTNVELWQLQIPLGKICALTNTGFMPQLIQFGGVNSFAKHLHQVPLQFLFWCYRCL